MEDYFGRKEYWKQHNRFLCDLWKNQYVSIIFAPAYLSNQGKKSQSNFYMCTGNWLLDIWTNWCRVLIISGSSPWKYIRECNILVLSWRIYVHWRLTVKICPVAIAPASNFQEERKIHSRWKKRRKKWWEATHLMLKWGIIWWQSRDRWNTHTIVVS